MVFVSSVQNTTDSAQLSVFLREIDKNFNITEELLSLLNLKRQQKTIYLMQLKNATVQSGMS